ncbi:Tetratricopeptide TPR_2 repeat protein, partial [Plesiocystis pacifica SIR-1]
PEADQALRTGILQILDGTLEPTHLAPLEPAWFVDRERLRELGAPAGARVPEPLMAELADKRGCEQILHGRIAAAGEAGYTLNLELDRRVPRGEAEDAPPSPPAAVELGPAPLLDAIDDASEWLGRELSPGRRQPTRTLVRDRYTADEEALRLYFAAREPFAEDDPQRKFDLAHAAFERDPTFVRAGWLAARHSRLVNANARTLELMGRAIDHDYRLDDAERLDARAFLLELEGKRALAEQAYQDALVYAPGDVDILMSLAELRMGRNDRDGAREVLEQVVSVDATHIAALRGMWILSLNDPERYQLSRQFAETLVELRPEDAKYHLMLGNSWLRLRELDKAKIELGRAYALEPDNPIYASGDADLEIIAGNHEKGLKLHVDPVQKALEQFEANPRDREARDTYHAIAGKYARRLLMFGRTREAYAAIEAVPRWLIEHSELPPAQLLFTLNNQDENYLLAYGYAGHEEEAYALLDRLDAGEAETAQLMLLGTKLDVAIAADDRARAETFHDEIETILAREPILRDAVGVIFTLRWHIYNEDWAAATALWDAHRETAADDPFMQQIVVEALAGTERWDELEVIVEDLLEYIPNYAHMHVFRAQVQWSRGEREAARASLDEALRLWAHAEPDFAPYVDAKALRARYMDAG